VTEEPTRLRRRLRLDLEDLALAFETNMPEAGQYLDLDTGEVVLVQDDIGREVERVYQEIDGDDSAALAAELQRRGVPQDERDELLQADLVEVGFGTRFIRIPHVESHDAYEDMESFIETVQDARLQDRLWNAIRGKGAFRRFKDTLYDYPGERERWFTFTNAQMRRRVLDWLRDEGIEPILDEAPPRS
jgi:hypothetical protein